MSAVKTTSSLGAMPLFEEESAMLDNPNLPINIPASLLPTYRHMWKADKQCLMCGVGFGLTQHKYRCKFCYRGVCVKCSKHLFLHPELQMPKRCCNRCFRRFISSTLRDEIDAKIYERSGKLSVIEDMLTCERRNRQEISERLRDLEGEYRRMRLKITQRDVQFEKEIEGRVRKLEEMRKVREKLQEQRDITEKQLTSTRNRTAAVLQERAELEIALTQSSEHNKSLKSHLSRLQEEACRITHYHSPLKDALIPVNNDKETEASAGDSFLMDKENYELQGIGEETAEDLERELQFLQAENTLLKGTKPIQLRRTPRPLSASQAMAVPAQPERNCCTLF